MTRPAAASTTRAFRLPVCVKASQSQSGSPLHLFVSHRNRQSGSIISSVEEFVGAGEPAHPAGTVCCGLTPFSCGFAPTASISYRNEIAARGWWVSNVTEWLASLGQSEYTRLFVENRIDDLGVLPHLTEQDLKDIGIPLRHRSKMLAAIPQLAGAAASPPAPQPASAPEPKPQDTAERRQLTVMFCDLVGSTTLSTRLDPEDLRGIVNTYHRCCTDLVQRNGGFVAKYMGDGVLAYFGYPRASEHDAERAVRAGLALIDAVPKLPTSANSPLQVRIGVATGLVVVGDLIGTGSAQEQAVVGETPNLAARLQAQADPGTMVISASTRKLTGGLFVYRDLGGVGLKGFGENVPAWQVLGASAAESRFEALRADHHPAGRP